MTSMWRWIRHWIDWLRNDRLPLSRMRRGGSAASIRYETIGGGREDLPVPWLADCVIVEVLLHLPPPARRKSDFSLRFPHSDAILADGLRPEGRSRHRVCFRFPTPLASVEGDVLWKQQAVARISIPILTADEFLSDLAFDAPSLAIRQGAKIVPVRAFVPDTGTALIASGLLRATYSIAPLSHLGLSASFRDERTGKVWDVPVPLTAEQRAGTSTVVSAACPRRPRRPGTWTVTWRAGGRELAITSAEAIAARRFEDSIRVIDSRFVVAEKAGTMRVVRQIPAAANVDRLGPCFFVSSAESGAAGHCPLSVFATPSGDGDGVHLVTENVLITDAPTAFAPGLYAVADLARTGGFELRLQHRVLGTVSLSPVPPASLTAEGGFKPPPNFTWTVTAEEELLDRLGRLNNPNG
jgi:hypothetical protein